MKKRLLCILLVTLMILSTLTILSVAASAAKDTVPEELVDTAWTGTMLMDLEMEPFTLVFGEDSATIITESKTYLMGLDTLNAEDGEMYFYRLDEYWDEYSAWIYFDNDHKVTSIDFANEFGEFWNCGNFTKGEPPVTVAKVLAKAEGFPSTDGSTPDNAWKNGNGQPAYVTTSGTLYLGGASEGIDVSTGTILAACDGGYEYSDPSGAKVKFNLDGDKLVSIELSGWYASGTNGVYTVPPTDFSKFVLCGIIDGNEYGYGMDEFYVGTLYRFDAKGSLQASFLMDSYICVKTTDNANFYKFESYVTSGTPASVLKNMSGGANEWMFVPGGVDLVFTMTDLGNDTFGLSYAKKENLPEGAAWLVNEGDDHVWYKADGSSLTIGGTGAFSSLDAIENKSDIIGVVIQNNTVSVAGANAFAGFADAFLTLPDGWQGELPNDAGTWYGGVRFDLTAYPNVVKNVTFVQHWPWNGDVDITADAIGTDECSFSVSIYQKSGGEWKLVTAAPTITGDTEVDFGFGGKQTLHFLWKANTDLTESGEIAVEVKMGEAASAKSEAGNVDFRTSIALPEGGTTVEGVVYSDTLWGAASASDVTIGWKNLGTEETGVITAGLTGEGIAVIELPAKDGTYRLTCSLGGLTSFVDFTVTGFPVYQVTNGTTDTNGSISFDKTTAAEGDTVIVTVTPANGYQLKALKYNDGITDHDITKDATSGNYQFTMPAKAVTVTAEFKAVGGTGSGEWFGYCTENSQFYTSIGVGGGTSLTFAIKIPVASLPNRDVLSKVSFYTNESGTYHVRIYSTDPSAADPGTAAPDYEQEVTVSNPNKWEDVVLTTPYAVDKTKNLWIGIEATDPAYPAACSTEILTTTDCCMMYFQGTWSPITDLGSFQIQPWMIRGYFGARTLPYSFDFETDPFENGWTTIDADGNGHDWKTDTRIVWDENLGIDGGHCAISMSCGDYGAARQADNWLFSPAITIPAGGAIVSWYEKSQEEVWPDSYTVYVSETNTSTDPSGMTVICAKHVAVGRQWTKKTVYLSAEDYAGKTVYIAFHHQDYDEWFLKIDNFAAEPVHTHSFTYTANNGKITATCAQGCAEGYDTTPLTLTLTAPTSLVYDGNAKAFTFADGEATAWTGAGLELPTIIYYVKQSGQSTYMPLLGTLQSAGNYMAQITVDEKTAQVEFTIGKATPYIKTTPAPNDIEYGETLADSTLFGGYVQVSSTNTTQVGGLFEWKLGDTIPALSDSEITEYEVTFTPGDTDNFNTVSCKVKIRVTHTHAGVKQDGQPATETAAGYKDYYRCSCGLYFEEEACTTLIGDDTALAAWKAEGGNGHLDKLPHTHADGVKQNGQPATETAAGFKDYYKCSCGLYFEDEDCTVEIGDESALAAWKAEGGNGHLDKLPHTHADGEKQNGQPATETAAGFKDYYKCSCGLYFEDEECTVEIGDDTALAAWKAEGGNGYLDKLPHSHNFVKHNAVEAGKDTAGCKEYYVCSCGEAYEDEARTKKIDDLNAWKAKGGNGYVAPNGGDEGTNLWWLWVLIAVVVVGGGFCVWFFFIKKKDDNDPDDPDKTPKAPEPKPVLTPEEKAARAEEKAKAAEAAEIAKAQEYVKTAEINETEDENGTEVVGVFFPKREKKIYWFQFDGKDFAKGEVASYTGADGKPYKVVVVIPKIRKDMSAHGKELKTLEKAN